MRKYIYKLITYDPVKEREQDISIEVMRSFIFIPLSFVYRAAIETAALFCYLAPYRVKCKVISVGNITWGGTGKTPLVKLIGRYLKDKGHNPVILSRGYKNGDEPRMLAENLADIPVIVDKNRIRAAKRAIAEYKADVVILDDGLQQWRLKKDLEIVTINMRNPFGNYRVLPAGILRQGLSALRCAHMFVLTKVDAVNEEGLLGLKQRLGGLSPNAEIYGSVYKPVEFYNFNKEEERVGLDSLQGKSVALFSGIADPDSFADIVRSLGVNINISYRFFDHHNYTHEELEEIMKGAWSRNIKILVTTEKDAARLPDLQLKAYGLQLFILRIALKINADEEKFFNRLLRVFSA